MEANALVLVGALLVKEMLICLMWQNGSILNRDTEVPKLPQAFAQKRTNQTTTIKGLTKLEGMYKHQLR